MLILDFAEFIVMVSAATYNALELIQIDMAYLNQFQISQKRLDAVFGILSCHIDLVDVPKTASYTHSICYRPIMINAPAAIARIARMIPIDGIVMLTTCNKPDTTNHMPNNNIPTVLVNFISLTSFARTSL
jgi:hypothetical protein